MGARTDTRLRMVTSAALMLSERGVAGTSISGVLEHSQGPRGSVGHHFPGGRTELLTEALQSVGEAVACRLRRAVDSGASASEVYEAIAHHYRRRLISSGFSAGCPVWAGAQEAYADPALGPAVAQIVDGWIGLLAEALIRSGHDTRRAAEVATVCVSALEGAITMSRVRRSVKPLDLTLDLMVPLLAAPNQARDEVAVTDAAGSASGRSRR